jgi:hypothetical protein
VARADPEEGVGVEIIGPRPGEAVEELVEGRVPPLLIDREAGRPPAGLVVLPRGERCLETGFGFDRIWRVGDRDVDSRRQVAELAHVRQRLVLLDSPPERDRVADRPPADAEILRRRGQPRVPEVGDRARRGARRVVLLEALAAELRQEIGALHRLGRDDLVAVGEVLEGPKYEELLPAGLADLAHPEEVLGRDHRDLAAEDHLQAIDELRRLAHPAAFDEYAHRLPLVLGICVHVRRDAQPVAARNIVPDVGDDRIAHRARRERVDVYLQPAGVVAMRAEDEVAGRQRLGGVDLPQEVGDRRDAGRLDQLRVQLARRVGAVPEQLLEHLEPALLPGSEGVVHTSPLTVEDQTGRS